MQQHVLPRRTAEVLAELKRCEEEQRKSNEEAGSFSLKFWNVAKDMGVAENSRARVTFGPAC